MAIADDDPYVEELLGNAPDRAAAALPRRELRAEMALRRAAARRGRARWRSWRRPSAALSPLVALGLIAAFAVAQQVQFEVGIGYTVPSQLVLMPMLHPGAAGAGPAARRRRPADRAPAVAICAATSTRRAWSSSCRTPGYAVGPALVMAAARAGARRPRRLARRWPLALAAQALFDAGFTGLRDLARARHAAAAAAAPRSCGSSPSTPRWPRSASSPASPAERQPLAVALVLPIMGLLALFARERRAHIDKALALSHAYRGTALLMSDLLEADDAYTGGEHSHGVVALALAVGDALGLDARDRRNLEFAALLHDIGKIRVPDEIINKPGKLTDEEFAIVKRHPVDGQEMLERVGGVLAEVGIIVRHHHERWDGRGYPDGIAGEAIPLAARIICVCDAYSAMTTNRPYRAALPVADAVAELERCSGDAVRPGRGRGADADRGQAPRAPPGAGAARARGVAARPLRRVARWA